VAFPEFRKCHGHFCVIGRRLAVVSEGGNLRDAVSAQILTALLAGSRRH